MDCAATAVLEQPESAIGAQQDCFIGVLECTWDGTKNSNLNAEQHFNAKTNNRIQIPHVQQQEQFRIA